LYAYDATALQFRVEALDRGERTLEVSFPSQVRSAYPVNQTAYGLYFLPAGPGPHPAVVVLHVLGVRDLGLESSLGHHLAGRGIGAVLMALPYHLRRTPPGTESGDLFLRPSPEHLRQALVQSVVDTRCLLEFLARRPEVDPHRLGVVGLSLGAIVGLIVGQVDPRVSAEVAVVGSGYPADLVWQSAILADLRQRLEERGVTYARLAHVLAPVNACRLPVGNPGRHLLMIMAEEDTFVPTALQRRTWEALGRPPAVWLPSGHLTTFLRRDRLWGEIARFLGDVWSGRGYTPHSWWEPGLRVGLMGLGSLRPTVGVMAQVLRLDGSGRMALEVGYTGRGGLFGISQRLPGGLALGVGTPLTRDLGKLRAYWMLEMSF
jgi:dienelactone hydrolase